jgi:hypothetical protein
MLRTNPLSNRIVMTIAVMVYKKKINSGFIVDQLINNVCVISRA